MHGVEDREHLPTQPSIRYNSEVRKQIAFEELDSYCRFYGSSQFEGFVPRDIHLVDLLRVKLDVLDQFVVRLGSYHEAAVTVYLLSHFFFVSNSALLLIKWPDLRKGSGQLDYSSGSLIEE